MASVFRPARMLASVQHRSLGTVPLSVDGLGLDHRPLLYAFHRSVVAYQELAVEKALRTCAAEAEAEAGKDSRKTSSAGMGSLPRRMGCLCRI